MSIYLVGQPVALTRTFTLAGQATPYDPESVKLTVYAPDATQSTLTYPEVDLAKDGDGYKAIVTPDKPGQWDYVWIADDAPVQTGSFSARAINANAALAASLSLDEFKQRADYEGDLDDAMLADYLAAAFEQAQAPPPLGCGRLLTPDPVSDADPEATRAFTIGPASVSRTVLVPDARQITTVTVDGTITSDYSTVSRSGYITALTFPMTPGTDPSDPNRAVVVTGRFGFDTIPVSLREAIYVLAARMYYERAAQYADQVAIAEGTAVQAYYRQLPPRVKLAFDSFAPPAQNVRLA